MKNRYKEDYQRSGTGAWKYTGRYFTLQMDANRKKRTGWFNLAMAAAFLAAEILAGMINQDSSRTVWIVFPYLFLYLPTIWMMRGALAYLGAPLRMERSVYEHSLQRMRRSCLALIVLAAVNVVLDLIYLAMHSAQADLGRELLYLGCLMVLVLLGIWFGRQYDRLYAGAVIDEALQ